MKLGNNLEKLKEYLISKGFKYNNKEEIYESKEYTIYLIKKSHYIKDLRLQFCLKRNCHTPEKIYVELFFIYKFDSRDLAKLKTIISTIINN